MVSLNAKPRPNDIYVLRSGALRPALNEAWIAIRVKLSTSLWLKSSYCNAKGKVSSPLTPLIEHLLVVFAEPKLYFRCCSLNLRYVILESTDFNESGLSFDRQNKTGVQFCLINFSVANFVHLFELWRETNWHWVNLYYVNYSRK